MKKEYRPRLATLVDQPFDSNDWLYETKWDGFRLIAEVRRDSVRLFSRNGIEVTARYPSIAQALRTITEPCVIDGELVALDAKGRSRFQLLQNALRDERTKLRYCVFDILFLDGKDMRRKPLLERKALLKQVLPRSSLLRYSKHIKANAIEREEASTGPMASFRRWPLTCAIGARDLGMGLDLTVARGCRPSGSTGRALAIRQVQLGGGRGTLSNSDGVTWMRRCCVGLHTGTILIVDGAGSVRVAV
jgi:hypothetical protein